MQWIIIVSSFIFGLYQLRYRLLNVITQVPGLRKILVRASMNIPWLRQRLLSNIFQQE
ncbi:hypothetical protein [Halobacillus mangrovi]|uniref:hypothetical protein n=1 Tax=Halobacillus mangrovi TaxID=402384 RepID=UPI003D96EB3C